MVELLRTNDPVLISWLQALLADENIETFVLDVHVSVVEGSANAIPRRLMVEDENLARARQLMEESNEFFDRT